MAFNYCNLQFGKNYPFFITKLKILPKIDMKSDQKRKNNISPEHNLIEPNFKGNKFEKLFLIINVFASYNRLKFL